MGTDDPRQLAIDLDPPPSRRLIGPAKVAEGPAKTSQEAARTTRAGGDERRVLRSLHEDGPATDDLLEARLGLRHQTVSARRRGLVLKQLVRDSGERLPTRTGRQAIVWALTPRGAEAVRALNEERGR